MGGVSNIQVLNESHDKRESVYYVCAEYQCRVLVVNGWGAGFHEGVG